MTGSGADASGDAPVAPEAATGPVVLGPEQRAERTDSKPTPFEAGTTVAIDVDRRIGPARERGRDRHSA